LFGRLLGPFKIEVRGFEDFEFFWVYFHTI